MNPTNPLDPRQTVDHTLEPAADMPPNASTADGAPGQQHETVAYEGKAFPPESLPGIPGYEVLGVLGRGGMGVVYEARHLALKRTVALKMILAGGHAGAQERERFRIEAEAVARLQHPNIVQVHELGEHDGLPYAALEFVEGGTLARMLGAKPMAPQEAASLVKTLCGAVQLAHSRNIIHRDLKPANILMSSGGVPKITDFGLARQLDADSGQTRTGAVMGTPSYMSPEQASGERQVGPATDIYALGAILYECLTGRPPFKGNSVVETLDHVRSREPVAPNLLRASTPRDLETICLKCLRKEPEKRYASAEALGEDLRRWQVGEPILARPVGRVERLAKWVKRNPVVAGAAVTVLLALTLGATGSYLKYLDAEEQKGIAQEKATANRILADRNEKLAGEEKDQRIAAQELAKKNQQLADDNKKLAGTNQKIADSNLQLAVKEGKARTRAEAAEKQRTKQLLRAETLLYLGSIGRANDFLMKDDLPACRLALDECRWDLCGPEYGYLAQRVAKKDDNVSKLLGRPAEIASMMLSSDGKRLFFGGGNADPTIKARDLLAGKETLSLVGHAGPVIAMARSDDGKLLFSASVDKTIKVWDLDTGKEAFTLRGHDGPVMGLALSADGSRLYSASADKTIKVWDLKARQYTYILNGHTEPVFGLALSPDGKQLFSASADRTIRVWNLETNKEINTLRGHAGPVHNLALSADGARLFSTSFDKTIKVWDVHAGKETLSLRGHTASVNGLVLSPDGKRLFSASMDQAIRIWDLETGRETLALRGHAKGVGPLVLSLDGKQLFSAGGDRDITAWDLDATEKVRTLRGHAFAPLSLAVAADGKHLFSGSQDRNIKVWDLQTGKEILTLPGHTDQVFSLALSADGTRLFSGSGDSTIMVWDPEAGQHLLTLSGHTAPVRALALSADGQRLYSASHDKTIKVWDVQAGKAIRTLSGHAHFVYCLALSADGKSLYSGSADKTIKVWDLNSGTEKLTIPGHTDAVTSLALSADGKQLFSTSSDKTIKVWDLEKEKESSTLSKDTWSQALVLSKDGKRLFATSYTMIKGWDLEGGKEILSLDCRIQSVLTLALSADGRRLISGGSDHAIKAWDLDAELRTKQ